MTRAPEPNEDPAPGPNPGRTAEVAVTVVRTGGFAGIGRRWRIEADAGDARFWVQLIERCPWDRCEAGPADPLGADRFTWEISAAHGADEHRAELAEQQVRGPWRELIDAVRDATAPPDGTTPAPARPGPSAAPAEQ
ncbi:protealysin inhibitor emfourin [Microbacterium invictum]|uniref:Uncharacterized protein n=1 Tax=Microbacterium invictum TaxID=515415 RepID=A0AA40SNW4_9MICO|nr:protealysin inhibitor emfourin [Microbacterium invictum]MBB4139685.1 hypothetical protein [Microbacterium invictum]